MLDNKGKRDGSPREEAITQSLNVCSYWMTTFIKYSKWLENPSNIKAARFLSRGYVNMVLNDPFVIPFFGYLIQALFIGKIYG